VMVLVRALWSFGRQSTKAAPALSSLTLNPMLGLVVCGPISATDQSWFALRGYAPETTRHTATKWATLATTTNTWNSSW
jgi:hypothetical protein